ncbi:uncharacterized protein LOC134836170 isoform X3 [Culicoides brevitarsis]|uniref:uncharacterized protein LOC134836170 isoform X3 n=1 Tax=Culicoides brevitarsis TaxID=469753 RepID=UPI00307BF1D5
MNEYEQHGALTDEKREDLSQLVSEFMAKGVVKGGRAGHEAIAEATLILFPGTFEDDPKTLAEALYNRLSRQTQQRYGTESPEDIHSLLTVKQEQIFSVEDIVSENDTFRIPAVYHMPSHTDNTEKIREKVFRLAEKWKLDYISAKKATHPSLLNYSNAQAIVTVDFDETGKLVTIIECVICTKPIRIGYGKTMTRHGYSYNFTNTNFFHHLRTHFR